VREILRHVVEDGTGKAAQVSGFSVAGKTGTAQKFNTVTHQYQADRYLASFCGMVPADHPRLVIGVFLDEPKNSDYGGSEAAPLFSRIVRSAATYLHLEAGPIGLMALAPGENRS
jgi:cell division protein FtsI (penicillin-binding protein 3)